MSTPEPRLPNSAPALRRDLATWYGAARRPLPWRESSDPYAIWVSEVMLQQTTVAAVTPYWTRFVERFPSVEALAAAPLDEVLGLWAGLGYYRRARQLHSAAAVVVEKHGGRLPSTADELRTLPGIGPYTSAAIASIAYGEPVAAVDGNVMRVLARLCAVEGSPSEGKFARLIGSIADELVDENSASDHNQALMELGATLCTPRSPACNDCPWAGACQARDQGRVEAIPAPKKRREAVDVVRVTALVKKGDSFLLAPIATGRHNAGLLETPTATLSESRAPAGRGKEASRSPTLDVARRALSHATGLTISLDREIGRFRHAVTHHRIEVWVFAGRIDGEGSLGEWRWIEPTPETPLAGSGRKALGLAGTVEPERAPEPSS